MSNCPVSDYKAAKAAERRKAAKTVVWMNPDPADALMLLRMLGLVAEPPRKRRGQHASGLPRTVGT